MIIVLCEGNLDLEFFTILLEQMGFKRLKVDENYILRKLGLKYRHFRVLMKEHIEIFIFYPISGGWKAVLDTAKDISQQKDWKKKGVKRVILAVDLDNEKSVENKLKDIENSLRSKYTIVKRLGNYSFKCKKDIRDEDCYHFTVVLLGDPSLQERFKIKQEKYMIEDIIISSILENEKFKKISKVCIEFFKHITGDYPNQKALLKMLEAFCRDPDRGVYEILSSIKINIPDHVKQSLEEGLRVLRV